MLVWQHIELRRFAPAFIGTLMGMSAITALAQEKQPSMALGQPVENFSLDNCYGKAVQLRDFENSPVVALVFLGTECPLAKLYGPRLAELQERYADRGVQIIGINSNTQDSMTELVGYVNRHGITFPMLKDVGNRLADALGAERTPEAFLLDGERVVRYHGRIDNQYGVGYSREREAKPELSLAIDALLSGRKVELAVTDVVGCHIGRVKEMEPKGEITYAKDIASIFNARCVSCHRDGEIAPFNLTSYKDVLGWEDTILEVITNNRMPPWTANPNHGQFLNDARLSELERELLATWVENGMPEGDPADLPPAPTFTEGWRIHQPDVVVSMSDKAFAVPAEGVVDYQRFLVDPKWNEDKYLIASEARPDRREVVHHILVYVVPEGARRDEAKQILAGYAPGSPPLDLQDGLAIHVPAGSKLLFEMHYTPNGTAQEDLSYVGFRFADKKDVKKLMHGRAALNRDFKIPPGDGSYEVSATYTCSTEEDLLSMSPHMHLRGKAFRYEAIYPDGKREILLDVPNYDFNWQLKYILKEPIRLVPGTRVECLAIFDNSESNLSNPNPTIEVDWGDQSVDEMMIGFMETIPVGQEL